MNNTVSKPSQIKVAAYVEFSRCLAVAGDETEGARE